MEPILGNLRSQRRNLDDLVHQGGRVAIARQALATATALLGEALLGVSHLLGRQQLAPVPIMAALPAARAPRALARATLVAVRRRISRRWSIGIRRVLTQPGEQLLDLLSQLGVLPGQRSDLLLQLRDAAVFGIRGGDLAIQILCPRKSMEICRPVNGYVR